MTPSDANADAIYSQMEGIVNMIKRLEDKVDKLQSELDHLKISAATSNGHDFCVKISVDMTGL